MLKENRKEIWIRLCECLVDLLAIYSLTVLMAGVIEGVMGGYLLIAAVFVIGGCFVAGILLQVYRSHHMEENDPSFWIELVLFVFLSFLFTRKTGWMSLVPAGIVGISSLWKKEGWHVSGMFLGGMFGSLVMLVNGFSYGGSIACGLVLFVVWIHLIKRGLHRPLYACSIQEGDLYVPSKKMILPIVLKTIGQMCLVWLVISFVPAVVTALHTGSIFQGKRYFLFDGILLIVALLSEVLLRSQKKDIVPLYVIEGISSVLTIVGTGIFLSIFTVSLGLIFLFGWLALLAGGFLLWVMNRRSPIWSCLLHGTGSFLVMELIFFTAYFLYDGMKIDSTVIWMVGMLAMTFPSLLSIPRFYEKEEKEKSIQ